VVAWVVAVALVAGAGATVAVGMSRGRAADADLASARAERAAVQGELHAARSLRDEVVDREIEAREGLANCVSALRRHTDAWNELIDAVNAILETGSSDTAHLQPDAERGVRSARRNVGLCRP
jgi:uncharacterized protein (DUF3084 family)